MLNIDTLEILNKLHGRLIPFSVISCGIPQQLSVLGLIIINQLCQHPSETHQKMAEVLNETSKILIITSLPKESYKKNRLSLLPEDFQSRIEIKQINKSRLNSFKDIFSDFPYQFIVIDQLGDTPYKELISWAKKIHAENPFLLNVCIFDDYKINSRIQKSKEPIFLDEKVIPTLGKHELTSLEKECNLHYHLDDNGISIRQYRPAE